MKQMKHHFYIPPRKPIFPMSELGFFRESVKSRFKCFMCCTSHGLPDSALAPLGGRAAGPTVTPGTPTPPPPRMGLGAARQRGNGLVAYLAALFGKRLDCGPRRDLLEAVGAMVRGHGGAATLAAAEEYFVGCWATRTHPTAGGLAEWLQRCKAEADRAAKRG